MKRGPGCYLITSVVPANAGTTTILELAALEGCEPRGRDGESRLLRRLAQAGEEGVDALEQVVRTLAEVARGDHDVVGELA